MHNVKRLSSCALLITMLVSGLILVFATNFGIVQASIEVSGIIASDTTWTKANSPYKLTGPVLVSNGVTLTIEAGVEVNLNGHYVQVNGTLQAVGSSVDMIRFRYGIHGIASVTLTDSSTSWNEQTSSGTIIENAILSLEIHDTSPKINENRLGDTRIYGGSPVVSNNVFGGGESLGALEIFGGSPVVSNNFFNFTYIHIWGGSPLISNNNITGTLTFEDWQPWHYLPDYGINLGGPRADGSMGSGEKDGVVHITDNIVSSHYKAGIYVATGIATIENNLITNNGDGIYLVSQATIRNNTIINNGFGFRLDTCPAPTISYNNIQNNTWMNMHLKDVSYDVDATYNWWGTTNTILISQEIKDFEDDFNLGTVNFTPFLTELNTQAPAVPTLLSISVQVSSTVVGSAVNIQGQLTDMDGNFLHGKLVSVSYSVTGDNWIPIGSCAISAVVTGAYDIQWFNTDSGTFMLKAEWDGYGIYSAANATITLSSLSYQNQSIFFIQSTSKVTDLTFDTTNTKLIFNISEASGTNGYVTATIPKDLLSVEGDWIVLADGNPVTFSFWDDENKTYLQFTYEPNTKTIEIIGTEAIPEFTSWIVLPLLLTSTLLIIFCRRKLTKTPSQQSY
jgi:parallel beta-helix repeat protein